MVLIKAEIASELQGIIKYKIFIICNLSDIADFVVLACTHIPQPYQQNDMAIRFHLNALFVSFIFTDLRIWSGSVSIFVQIKDYVPFGSALRNKAERTGELPNVMIGYLREFEVFFLNSHVNNPPAL